MKSIFHIGMQKTGSSSIQVMLASSISYLKEIGYSFPTLPKSELPKSSVWTSPFRHNCIAATFADFNSTFERLTPNELGEFWTNATDNGLIPKLSAEEFSRQRDFSVIGKALSGAQITVVVYLRRQDKFVESLYNQRNKILASRADTSCLGESFLTEKDLIDFINISGYNRMLDYVDLLCRLENQLTPTQILVMSFEPSALVGGDVCTDFCHALGLDHHLMCIPTSQANQSLGNNTLRLWNDIYLQQGTDAAVSFISDVNKKIQLGANYSGSYSIFSEERRGEFLEHFEMINDYLRKAHGIRF